VAPVGSRGNELDNLANLCLAHAARTEWVVQHHREELNRPPVAFNRYREHLSDSRIVLSPQLAAFDNRQRPAGNQADARSPIVLLPAAPEHVMFHAEPLGNASRLRRPSARPGLDQANDVGIRRDQRIFNGRLSFLPLPVAAPYVPRHDPQAGFNNGSVRRILIEAHLGSLPGLLGSVQCDASYRGQLEQFRSWVTPFVGMGRIR
jgi:hypothetical protein